MGRATSEAQANQIAINAVEDLAITRALISTNFGDVALRGNFYSTFLAAGRADTTRDLVGRIGSSVLTVNERNILSSILFDTNRAGGASAFLSAANDGRRAAFVDGFARSVRGEVSTGPELEAWYRATVLSPNAEGWNFFERASDGYRWSVPSTNGASGSWSNVGDNAAAVAARARLETQSVNVVPSSSIRVGSPVSRLSSNQIGRFGENALAARLTPDLFAPQARITVTLDDGSTFVVIPDFLDGSGAQLVGNRLQLIYREAKASTIRLPTIGQLTDNQARFVDAILSGRIQSITTTDEVLLDLVGRSGATNGFDVVGFELSVFEVIP